MRRAKFSSDLEALAALRFVADQHTDLHAALDAADWIIPVPSGKKSLRHRGFNTPQQVILHSQKTNLSILGLDSKFEIEAAPQHSLNRQERLKIKPNPFIAKTDSNTLRKKLLLFDDVMTTGATLHKACLALAEIEPASIHVACFARTEFNK